MVRLFQATGLALGSALLSVAAMAGEYQCQLKDSSLRLAIEVEKSGHSLPCEVVVEDDRGERAVLYSAQYDRDYCPNRLDVKRADLESKGWSCQQSSDEYVVEGTGRVRPVSELVAQAQLPTPTPTPKARPQTESSSEEAGRQDPAEDDDERRDAVVAESESCQLGDDVRRLTIEVEDSDQGKPCALFYWAEDDESETGQRLWRAEHDSNFCKERLGFILDKWSKEGWRCDVGEVETVAEPRSVEPDTETTKVEPAPSPLPKPAAEQVSDPEPAAEAPVEQAAIPASPAPAEAEADAPPTPNVDAAAPPPVVIDQALQAIIEADARRIGEWMEVDPEIEVAARGDLNDDGHEDAVVFLTYQSKQAAYRQYLMGYLTADETYELAGVKLLTGVNPPPAHAQVEQIDNGVIWLSLSDENGLRQRPTGYALRDQQLVEIDLAEQAKSASDR